MSPTRVDVVGRVPNQPAGEPKRRSNRANSGPRDRLVVEHAGKFRLPLLHHGAGFRIGARRIPLGQCFPCRIVRPQQQAGHETRHPP